MLAGSTRIQIQGVLDSLFPYSGQLGVVYSGSSVSLRLWAPTASRVQALIYATPNTTASTAVALAFDTPTGVWFATSTTANWNLKYYVYQVTVYVPETSSVVTNTVTDPYSVSLAA